MSDRMLEQEEILGVRHLTCRAEQPAIWTSDHQTRGGVDAAKLPEDTSLTFAARAAS